MSEMIDFCRNRSLFDILYTSFVVKEPYQTENKASEMVLFMSPGAAYRTLLNTLTEPVEGGLGWQSVEEGEVRAAWKKRALAARHFQQYRDQVPGPTSTINALGSRAYDLLKGVDERYANPPKVTLTPGTAPVAMPLANRAGSAGTPIERAQREDARRAIRAEYEEAIRATFCAEFLMAQLRVYFTNKRAYDLAAGGRTLTPGVSPAPSGQGFTPTPGVATAVLESPMVLPGFTPTPGVAPGGVAPASPGLPGGLPSPGIEGSATVPPGAPPPPPPPGDPGLPPGFGATDAGATETAEGGSGFAFPLILLLAAGGAAYVMTKK